MAKEATHESQGSQPGAAPSAPALKPKRVQRAAVDAMLHMRPQPNATEVNTVLESLSELDADGNPKHKFADAKAAGEAAKAKAKELLAADKKAEDDARAAREKESEEEAKQLEKKGGGHY